MKKRKIKFSEKYECIFANMILIIFLVILNIFTIKIEEYFCVFLVSLVILIFILLIVLFYKYNIVFDYEKKVIIILEPGHWKKSKINMLDIKVLQYYENPSIKKSAGILFSQEKLYNFHPQYIYNNGKKYIIEIIKKDGSINIINYNSLFKCRSKKRIKKFEAMMVSIIEEFNKYKTEMIIKNKKIY